jgi:hypothetical protein
MDFELEMAFFVGGPPTKLGCPVPIKEAQEHIFGMALMNDWSGKHQQRCQEITVTIFLYSEFPWHDKRSLIMKECNKNLCKVCSMCSYNNTS